MPDNAGYCHAHMLLYMTAVITDRMPQNGKLPVKNAENRVEIGL